MGSHYNQLTIEDREIIRDMLYSGKSAREISRRLRVSASTITREIKKNKTYRIPALRSISRSVYCKNYKKCKIESKVCVSCNNSYTFCKACKKVQCTSVCNEFSPVICELTEKWPYVCTDACKDRHKCKMPKFSYSSMKAQEKRDKILVESRQGINASSSELIELVDVIKPLTKQGHSFYAIKTNNSFINVSLKTLYNYQNQGYFGLTDVDLPRKVRYKKRKTRKLPLVIKELRVNREYKDFKNLPKELQDKAFELDSVEGFKTNVQRVFSFHNRKSMFQIYNLVKDSSSAEIVKVIDMYEYYLGSCEEFNRLIPIMLLDRGSEFDDVEGLERSCFDHNKKRCSVFFCDPNSPFQKGKCENNHEFFRRIAPKKHSDFDKLTNFDMAVITSHINSYVRASLDGKAPIDLASKIFPKEFFEMLGIEKVNKNNVWLKPDLVPHIFTN